MPRATQVKGAPRRKEEATLQERCAELLILDKWRRIKTDLKHLRGMGVQEPGMADDYFVRYLPPLLTAAVHDNGVRSIQDAREIAEVMRDMLRQLGGSQSLWIEWKAKDGVHGLKQLEWQMLERERGALVWVAKKDFEPTVDGFWSHYTRSGLLENKGLRLGPVQGRRIC